MNCPGGCFPLLQYTLTRMDGVGSVEFLLPIVRWRQSEQGEKLHFP